MKQRIQDFQLLLKKDRKTQVLLVILGAMVLFLLFFTPQPPNNRSHIALHEKPEETGTGAIGTEEAYEDLLKTFTEDIDTLKNISQTNAEETQELRQNMTDYEKRTAEIFKKILERISEDSSAPAAYPGESFPQPIDASMEDLAAGGEVIEDDLESFGEVGDSEIAPPPIPPAARVAVVSAGDSARVKLLAGVNAPTDGTPYPVVFQLSGSIQGPDGSDLSLGEARLIAAAQGSLSDQRALFRLSRMSVRLPDGRRHEVAVDGWIVGEDGVRGMPGVLIDPIGKLIVASGVGGALEGFGQAVSRSNLDTRTNNDGSISEVLNGSSGQFAAGRALGGAAGQWNSILQQRVSELVPHVRILSGREATAVFSAAVTIEGLYEQLEDGEFVFTSLD